MPRIFDNLVDESRLIGSLRRTLALSHRADFCVGYFNVRGWRLIDEHVDSWPGGDGTCCRLLVGMQRLPQEELRAAIGFAPDAGTDHGEARRLRRQVAEEFREQLALGAPSNADEAGLRRLSRQLRERKVVVKLHLRHTLHAKLYLLYRVDPNNPVTGFLGSSNLTMSGLSAQGELNVDVLEHDACAKLARWFDDRWGDTFCLDISDELADTIDASWARERAIPPYHIYLKMAYHLSQEARAGLAEFEIPREFRDRLFAFQAAAVKIAAHHLNRRGGVLLGDVVGLGKTLMACALARIFEDDFGTGTLIICPPNLSRMWEDYVGRYGLRARVLPSSRAIRELQDIPARFKVVVIDESHNLRNREGKTYRAIQEYVAQADARCVLLSATPYNKDYADLSAQLRLFVPEDRDLGVRPERYLAEVGEAAFNARHQCSPRTIAAFEHSPHADDWRELMRLYMVRRTRSFIRDNYAEQDPATGRRYLRLADGDRSFFPERVPVTATFAIRGGDDPYARLYADAVVDAINGLRLPRYGLGNHVAARPEVRPTPEEARKLKDLGRAGKRLMGFCRTNLFKRLESGGPAYLQSLDRHILRNHVVLHALANDLQIPIGTQDAALLDTAASDADDDTRTLPFDDSDTGAAADGPDATPPSGEGDADAAGDYRARAAATYDRYAGPARRRFGWLRPGLFDRRRLEADLRADSDSLVAALRACGPWDAGRDAKLASLVRLLTLDHPDEKVLVFTQFADTVRYLTDELAARGVGRMAGVTADTPDPTGHAARFSPMSNGKRISEGEELRVLVTTDVLSEGQNLQDCHIVVNYDLPWAIVRLIQRAGRVDRIGQRAERILVYSFLPAEGVERIIGLRRRVLSRLRENAEVIGTDERFFEEEEGIGTLLDLYNERADALDVADEGEVDLASYAYQIWKNATDRDPSLLTAVPALPAVAYSTRAHRARPGAPAGALVYLRTREGSDALAWVDEGGTPVTQSQLAILQEARCEPDTPAVPRPEGHHDIVASGATYLAEEDLSAGGQLGRPSSPRHRTYARLKDYAQAQRGTLFASPALPALVELLYQHPLQEQAADILRRQLKAGVGDATLADLVTTLGEDARLCVVHAEQERQEAQIICSLGLDATGGDPR